jgi:hypothetical protein
MRGLRNLGYDDLVVCYILGPLVDVTPQRALEALRDALRSPRGASLLHRRTRGRRWKSVDAHAAVAASAGALVPLEGGLDRAALAARVLETVFEPGELPVRVFVGDGMLAFALPHSLFDGTGATAMVSLVAEKLGAPGVDAVPARPWAAAPLRAALTRFELRGVAGVRSARETFRSLTARTETGYQLPRTLTKAESIARTRMVSTVLTPDEVRTIATTPEQAVEGRRPARPPLSVKTASLVLRCLRESDREGADFRVVVPIDARRWVEKGTDAEGNFSPSVPMGRLLADEWTATALAERISAASKSGVPIAWLLATTLIAVKNTLRHPRAGRRPSEGTPRVPFEIHVSLPTSEVALTESLLPRVTADTFVGGMPAHRRLPLGVWVEVAPLRDCLHVIVRDETGVFDLDGFDRRLRTMIATTAEAGKRS